MSGLMTILGPTASGKTGAAIELASKWDAEIVSCDSMQVYRGLDIGTAKPTPDERAGIPHHLLDICDMHVAYGAKSYVDDASRVISEIHGRGRNVILCGGTGFYAKSLIYGLSMNPSDPDVAADIARDLNDKGRDALLSELKKIDPVSAERVQDNNRRLTRAVEIVRITGTAVPPSKESPNEAWVDSQYILLPDTDWSQRLICERTDEMMERGWLDETASLIENGLLETPTAAQAIGYRLIGDYLAAESKDMEHLKEQIVIQTRQFAKRQRTWFRHQHPGATHLPFSDRETYERLIRDIPLP